MCGILGEISFHKERRKSKIIFKKALDLQYHRGPDDSDIYHDDYTIFGHRRLSIIDLNTHAKQPMVSNCKRYILIFNGEIYNYLELREILIQRGYHFHTKSDTEVLLNGFIEYGIEIIHQLIGMFSFAIYDNIANESYIVRDRLGVKPLYYTHDKDGIIFSSEIKSILALDTKKRTLNMSAVSSYLSFRYPILNNTFFKGIESLPPAHYIKISNNLIDIVEYWSLKNQFKEQQIDRGEEYYIEKLHLLLESSIDYRMISDVPIGAFLSGGVDSSIITAIMSQKSENPIKTFTIGFTEDGFNEFNYAKIVAELYNTEHREIILSADNYIQTMEKLISYKDAPLSVPNEVPLYLMSQELKKYITVVLSGEGADEIFGGYGRIFRSPYDLERLQQINNLEYTPEQKREYCKNFLKKYISDNITNEIDHFINIYSYTSFDDKSLLLNNSIDLHAIEENLLSKFMYYFDEIDECSYYNKIMYVFEKIHLLGLLHRVDTTTMAASIEARVPFVDHRLVEFAFTIPMKYKLKWIDTHAKEKSKLLMSDQISEQYDTPKYILKKAYEDLLPSDILYRKKMGFPVPLNNWFGGDFNDYAKEILLSDISKARGVYNTENIQKWLNSNRLSSDHSFAMKIWMLINLELFQIKYFDKKEK